MVVLFASSGCDAMLMDIKSIRRTNARLLVQVECDGVLSAFADRMGKFHSQVSAIIGKNPTKGIGDGLAREIEAEFRKPRGWLDHTHTENSGMPMTERQYRLIQAASMLTDKQLLAIIELMEVFSASERRNYLKPEPPHKRKKAKDSELIDSEENHG